MLVAAGVVIAAFGVFLYLNERWRRRPRGVVPVLRNHVSFAAIDPAARTWRAIRVLEDFADYLRRRPHGYRMTPIMQDGDEAHFSVCWFEENFHRVVIRSSPRGWAGLRYYGLGVLWIVVLAVPLVLVLFYFERLFPYVPASLGGPAPRCVSVDLATDNVSSDTIAALVSTEPPVLLPIAGVRRTRELALLFSGPEFVMVRLDAQRSRGPVYALAKDAIRALAPCRQETRTVRGTY